MISSLTRNFNPLRCCDSECARANGCIMGGYQCKECGEWFCKDTDGGEFFDGMNYTCRQCADRLAKQEEEDEE